MEKLQAQQGGHCPCARLVHRVQHLEHQPLVLPPRADGQVQLYQGISTLVAFYRAPEPVEAFFVGGAA